MQTFLFCLYILKEISSIILFSAVAASIVYAYCGDHKNLKDDKNKNTYRQVRKTQ